MEWNGEAKSELFINWKAGIYQAQIFFGGSILSCVLHAPKIVQGSVY